MTAGEISVLEGTVAVSVPARTAGALLRPWACTHDCYLPYLLENKKGGKPKGKDRGSIQMYGKNLPGQTLTSISPLSVPHSAPKATQTGTEKCEKIPEI